MPNPIIQLYPLQKPLALDEVCLELVNPNVQQKLEEPIKGIDKIIKQKLKEMDLPGSVNPLHLLPSQADTLRTLIKNEGSWRKYTRQILESGSTVLGDTEECIDAIAENRPWFNEAVVYYISHDASSGLKILGSLYHSYLGILSDQQIKYQREGISFSIAGVPRTVDNQIILGYRGGHNFSDTIMAIPAGSIVREINYSFMKEMHEELGCLPKDKIRPKVVGMLYNPHEKRQYLVVDIHIDMPLADVNSAFIDAPEKEHRFLVFAPDDLDKFLTFNRDKIYRIDSENPEKRAETTKDNTGKILPQCTGTLLTSYASRMSRREYDNVMSGYSFFKDHYIIK